MAVLSDVIQRDVIANIPAAGVEGRLFASTDETPNTLYRDNGSTWDKIAEMSSGGTMSSFDLDADSGSAETVENGETVTISGGTGIDTSVAATNDVTVAIDSTVATLTGSQTLTNKTLTTPTIGSFTNATHDHEDAAGGGQLTADAIDSGAATDGHVLTADGAGNAAWEAVSAGSATPNYGTAATKTLSSDIATAGSDRNLVIAAESGTTDDLIEISGLDVGDKVIIKADSGDTITVIHNDAGATDKIFLTSGSNYDLSGDVALELTKIAAGEVRETTNTAASSGTDSDAIHDNVNGEINAITAKASPVSGDLILIEDSAASYAKKKVQIGNLPGGGGGSTKTIDTYANLPGSPSSGDEFYQSNGPLTAVYDGSAWNWRAGGYPVTLPVDGDFSWINQDSATVDDTNGYLLISKGSDAADSYCCRVKSAPSTPYTIKTMWSVNAATINRVTFGTGWRQSSDGKLILNRVTYDSGWGLTHGKHSSPTTGAGNYGTQSVGMTQFFWVTIEDDGSDRAVSVSADGQNFIELFSSSRTDYMTPDQVLFFIAPRNSSYGMSAALWSWEES